jgi:hypothetical protein
MIRLRCQLVVNLGKRTDLGFFLRRPKIISFGSVQLKKIRT